MKIEIGQRWLSKIQTPNSDSSYFIVEVILIQEGPPVYKVKIIQNVGQYYLYPVGFEYSTCLGPSLYSYLPGQEKPKD